MSLSARLRASRDDEGLGLIEVVVSIAVAAMVLLAVLASSIFAVRASAEARKNQQAEDYANAAIEAVRGLSYAGASMRTADLTGDSSIVTVSGVKKFDPGTGLETIDATTSGLVTPHIADADKGKNGTNGAYKIYRYVTVPAGATYNAAGVPSVRRLTVIIKWVANNRNHTRKSSTLLTNTRRGLPLPNYTFKYNGPATMSGSTATWTKNPGNSVDYGMVLNNLGARDSWTITASTTGWTFYTDTDHDGLLTSGEPALSPVNTGLIEPGAAPVYVVAHRDISLLESGTTTTTFTATSDAQPTYPSRNVATSLTVVSGAVVAPSASPTATATASASASPTASAGPCTPGTATVVDSSGIVPAGTTNASYTLSNVWLFNGTTGYDTTTQAYNTMGTDPSGWHDSLCNWSTESQTAAAGRLLPSTGTYSIAEWRFQPGSAAQDQMRGTPVLSFWAQCTGTSSPTITVKLQTLSGSTYTPRATGTASQASSGSCPTTGFAKFYASLPVTGFFVIPLTDRLVVQVTSTQPVRLGYGTFGLPAKLEIGMK